MSYASWLGWLSLLFVERRSRGLLHLLSLKRSWLHEGRGEFANTESCAAGAPPPMKLSLPYPLISGDCQFCSHCLGKPSSNTYGCGVRVNAIIRVALPT